MPNDTNKKSQIIPFGKYKGQPIQVLDNDPKYVDWLMSQDWLEKYPTVYQTLIVNNHQEATDTPEHNAIQVLFLDDDFCENFARLYLKKAGIAYIIWDDPNGTEESKRIGVEIKPQISDDYPSVLRQMQNNIEKTLKDFHYQGKYYDRQKQKRFDYDIREHVLLLRTYSGIGATREQFIKTFGGIKIFFLEDIENQK
jgi:hypothetical protein